MRQEVPYSIKFKIIRCQRCRPIFSITNSLTYIHCSMPEFSKIKWLESLRQTACSSLFAWLILTRLRFYFILFAFSFRGSRVLWCASKNFLYFRQVNTWYFSTRMTRLSVWSDHKIIKNYYLRFSFYYWCEKIHLSFHGVTRLSDFNYIVDLISCKLKKSRLSWLFDSHENLLKMKQLLDCSNHV